MAAFTVDASYFASGVGKLTSDDGNFTDGVKISSNGGCEITNGRSESTNRVGKTTNGEIKLTVGVIKFTNRNLDFTNEIIKTTNRWAKRTNRGVKLTNDVKISSNSGFGTAKCTILAAVEWLCVRPMTELGRAITGMTV